LLIKKPPQKAEKAIRAVSAKIETAFMAVFGFWHMPASCRLFFIITGCIRFGKCLYIQDGYAYTMGKALVYITCVENHVENGENRVKTVVSRGNGVWKTG